MAEYLSTDPNAGTYLSTDPNAGATPQRRASDKPKIEAGDLESPVSKGLGGITEAALNLGSSAVLSPIANIAGLGAIPLHAMGLIKTDPTQVKESIQGAAYEPKSAAGKAVAEYNPIALLGKLLSGGAGIARKGSEALGKAAGVPEGVNEGVGRGLEEAIMQAPGVLGVRGQGALPSSGVVMGPPRPTPPRPRAEAAVDELQRQREVLESKHAGPTPGPASPVETAMGRSQGASGQFQEVLHRDTGKYSAAPASQHIDQLMRGDNTALVRDALDSVKKEIDIAVGKSAGPKADTYDGYVLKDGKLVKDAGGKPSGDLSLNALDNIRQHINTLIRESKDGYVRDTLYSVQNALLKDAPPEYRRAIEGIHEARTGVEQHQAPGNVRDKVTTDPAQYQNLTAADKQSLAEKAFTDKTPGAAIGQFVRSVAHDPAASSGLRVAYTDWLTKPNPRSKVLQAGDLVGNWEKTKNAVEQSGMFTPDHFAAIDTVVNSINEATHTGPLRRGAAGATGALVGGAMGGHAIAGAAIGRTVASEIISKKNMRELDSAIMKITSDPHGAQLMAAPPTPGNLARARQMLTNIAPGVTFEAQEERAKRSSPLTMNPILQ